VVTRKVLILNDYRGLSPVGKIPWHTACNRTRVPWVTWAIS
jgi:hypothetical protein